MSKFSDALLVMSTMSDDMIDKSITPRLATLAEKPDPYELARILDECAYGALCTDSMMIAMNWIQDGLKREIYA